MKSIAFALIAPLLWAIGPTVQADGNTAWRVLGYSDEEEWSGQFDSMTLSATDLSAKTISMDGRILSKKTRHVDQVRWSVTVEDCNADAGDLVTSDLSGKYVVKFAFVKGASSFESITAQAICAAHFNANK